MKLLISFLLIFSSTLYAQSETFISKVRDGDKEWSMFLTSGQGPDKLEFKEKKGHSYIFESDSIAHHFVRIAPLTFPKNKKLYFITVWAKGAHGESIKVINPELSENNVVFNYNSAWPLTYEFKNGELIVKGKSGMDENTGIPKDEIVKFRP